MNKNSEKHAHELIKTLLKEYGDELHNNEKLVVKLTDDPELMELYSNISRLKKTISNLEAIIKKLEEMNISDKRFLEIIETSLKEDCK